MCSSLLSLIYTFQLFEQRGFGTDMLAEVEAKIPDASVTSQSVHLEDYIIENNNKVNHPHEGIGSGQSLCLYHSLLLQFNQSWYSWTD